MPDNRLTDEGMSSPSVDVDALNRVLRSLARFFENGGNPEKLGILVESTCSAALAVASNPAGSRTNPGIKPEAAAMAVAMTVGPSITKIHDALREGGVEISRTSLYGMPKLAELREKLESRNPPRRKGFRKQDNRGRPDGIDGVDDSDPSDGVEFDR
jgi:hypothetical protein